MPNQKQKFFLYPLSVAPMLDYTDRHFRYLLRLLSKHVLLYTEMITTQAILQGDCDFLLKYHLIEHPLVLQLGGSDPKSLAKCAVIGQDYGYDGINLNVGCPSSRVQKGRFGACLMKEPELVAECVAGMQAAVKIPVTVKMRLGVDNYDSYTFLQQFVATVADAGCKTFIVHARKAWLKGLSPKQNRAIPPLMYEKVYCLKQDFPQLNIVLNGGITTLEQMQGLMHKVDGLMVGRAICQNPYLLAEVDKIFYEGTNQPLSRFQWLEQFVEYSKDQLQQGVHFNLLSRHVLNLFNGMPGAAGWRRYISENAFRPEAGLEVLFKALEFVLCR